MQRSSIAAAALCAVLGLTACGGNSDTETVTQVTVVQTQAAAAPSEGAAREETVAEPAAEENEPTEVAEAAASSDDDPSDSITVPNVVGKNHQLAQDTMQDAGLYNLAEEDATGEDRPLLWDRNWVVVSQTPSAGERVSSDKTVTLRSKKETD